MDGYAALMCVHVGATLGTAISAFAAIRTQTKVDALVAEKKEFQTNIVWRPESLDKIQRQHFILDPTTNPSVAWPTLIRIQHGRGSNNGNNTNNNNNNNDDASLSHKPPYVTLSVPPKQQFRVDPKFRCMAIRDYDLHIRNDWMMQSLTSLRYFARDSGMGPVSKLFKFDTHADAYSWPLLGSPERRGDPRDDADLLATLPSTTCADGTTTTSASSASATSLPWPHPPYRVTEYSTPGLLLSLSRDKTGLQQFTVHAASTDPAALADHAFDNKLAEAQRANVTAHALFTASVAVMSATTICTQLRN